MPPEGLRLITESENGISTEEAGQIARATNSNAGNNVADAAAILALFQVGPRTGNPVYNEHYAENVVHLIAEKCPNGRVTGLTSIREMRKYPVISGEIVKVTGLCLTNRQPAGSNEPALEEIPE